MKQSPFLLTGIVLVFLTALAGVGFYLYQANRAPAFKNEQAIATTSPDGSQPETTDLQWEMRTTVFGLGTTTRPYFTHYHDQIILKKLQDISNSFEDSACVKDAQDLQDVISNRTEYSSNPTQYSTKQLSLMSPAKVMDAFGLYSEIIVKVVYTKHDILSLSYEEGDYCGGAHPNYGTGGTTINLRTGDDVPFEKLFAKYEKDKGALAIIFTPHYIQARKQEDSPSEFKNDECVGITEESGFFDYLSYEVTDTGVRITPSLAHAEAPCETAFTVPVKELRPYLAKDSLLNRL